MDDFSLNVPTFLSFVKWPDDGRYGRNL